MRAARTPGSFIASILLAAAVGCSGSSPHPASPTPEATSRPPSPDAATATVAPVESPPTADEGRQVFDAKGCVACHSTDGSPRVGPTMKGYLGATLILEDGTQVIGSEARFLASLDKPEPLRNYPPSMPGYGDNLGARERQAMMIYVQSLR